MYKFLIGLDIPQCDLVIRFNKPNNFSSYMQSKGRARAKQNAFYVLFMDESNADTNQRDILEYHNYEAIEKVCQSEKDLVELSVYSCRRFPVLYTKLISL
jgi:endoribonuclease Dicer